MDIALLKEQYHWNKKKQQLQTNILLFKKASTTGNKDVNGHSLVNVVPINQEVRNSKSFEKQMAYDFVGDFEDYKTPWHTHLSIHRMANNSSRTSDTNTATATRELSSQTGPEPMEERSADPLKLEKSHGPSMPGSSETGEYTISTQRKFSAPAIMSRQLSLPDNKFSRPSSQMKYYPFPQKKCPKKSEAARKLGLYASY
uniref:TBC1 domain-containing protein n=1 Tax=Lepisosteus oculatus TaxID=7918 RepID=W5MUY0_LEPOC